MKLMHLSDLHLGKRLNEHALLEDQAYILEQILSLAEEEQPDGVLIAGDVYDKAIPSGEAVSLCNRFLVELRKRTPKIFLISGNHDSAERLAFGGALMAESGVYLSPVYDGEVTPISLTDEFGTVNIYLLPFLKPATLRGLFPEKEIQSYTDALKTAIDAMQPDFSQRNVLVAHQYVTGARGNGRAEAVVGGLDNVEADVFEGFDYVALGHIHTAQNVAGERVRYGGTPLNYSLNEIDGESTLLPTGAELTVARKKTVTMVELGEKGSLTLRTIPLTPLRRVVALRGSYDRLMLRDTYHSNALQEDYVYLTLTDETDVPNALGNLNTAYHRLLGMRYDNTRSRTEGTAVTGGDLRVRTPLELFDALYLQSNGQPVSEVQRSYLEQLIEKIWEVHA